MFAFKVSSIPKFVRAHSLILQFLLWGSLVSAQDVDLKFRIYVPDQGGLLTEQTVWKALPELFVQENGRYRRLAAARGQASRYFTYRGEAEMLLFTRKVKQERLVVEGMNEDDLSPMREKSEYIPYAKVRFPVAWEEAMVMIRPEERNQEGLCWAVAMNIDPSHLPKGKGTFYNASNRTLALTVGGKAHMIRAGQRLVLNRTQVKEKEVGDMAVGRMVLAEQEEQGGAWKPRYSRPVYLKPDVSNLFLISEAGNNRVRVRAVYGEEESS